MTPDTAATALRTALLRVAPEADLGDLDPDESLRDALDLDSLDFLALVENVAMITGVSVPESDYAAVETFAGFIGYLRRRMT